MRRSRQVLAVAFLATALCADRAATAAPMLRPQMGQGTLAGRLVNRLTVGLRRVVPSARVYETRREDAAPTIPSIAAVVVQFTRVALSPFQFRLPPPAL